MGRQSHAFPGIGLLRWIPLQGELITAMLELDLMLSDSRRRIRESETRATLLSQLGTLPPLTGLPLFSRTPRPLEREFVIQPDAAALTAAVSKAA